MSSSGESSDRSLADLMAGVAVVFLLLAVIFILEARKQREEAIRDKEVAIGKVDSQKDGVQATLVALREDLVVLNSGLDGGFIALSGLSRSPEVPRQIPAACTASEACDRQGALPRWG